MVCDSLRVSENSNAVNLGVSFIGRSAVNRMPGIQTGFLEGMGGADDGPGGAAEQRQYSGTGAVRIADRGSWPA